MKKVLSVLLATATAVSVCGGLTACGGDDGKTLTVWAPSAAIPSYRQYAKGFKEAYPEYKDYTVKFAAMEEDVVQDKIGNGNQISTKAHVFFFPSDHLTALKKKGAVFAIPDEYTDLVAARDDEKVVTEALRDEKLYAFPATYDNGYMLYYDKTFYDDEDVKLLDDLQAKARNAKPQRTILYNVGSGYYASSMFWAAGVTFGYADEEGLKGYTVEHLTDEIGKAVGTACYNYFNPGSDANGKGEKKPTVIIDGNVNTGIGAGFADGSMVAAIGGTWAWPNIKDQIAKSGRKKADGTAFTIDDIGVTVLPEFKYTLGGEEMQKHMYSFIGYKYCGVNAKKPKEQIKASCALAEFLTREEGQLVRFEATNSGPSNKNLLATDDVKNNKVLKAFHEQEEYGVPHKSHPSAFWSPNFISQIMNGTTTKGKITEALTTWYKALTA